MSGSRLFVSILGHEFLVELGEVEEHVGHVLFARQKGEANVPRVGGLTETRARDGADTGSFEELMAVENVRKLFLGVGGFDGFGGHIDGGEGIHGTISRVARDTRERVQSVDNELGAALERVVNVVAFLNELVKGFISRLGGIDHERDHELTKDIGAQVDGAELVVLVHDLLSDAVHFNVSSTLSTLAQESLGH